MSDQVWVIQDSRQTQDSWHGLHSSWTWYSPWKAWPRLQYMSFPLQGRWVTSERLDMAWTKTQALLGPPPPPPSSTLHNQQRWFIVQTVHHCSKTSQIYSNPTGVKKKKINKGQRWCFCPVGDGWLPVILRVPEWMRNGWLSPLWHILAHFR